MLHQYHINNTHIAYENPHEFVASTGSRVDSLGSRDVWRRLVDASKFLTQPDYYPVIRNFLLNIKSYN